MHTRKLVMAVLTTAIAIPAMAGTCSPSTKKEAIDYVLTVAEPSLKKSIKENPDAKKDLPALQKIISHVRAAKNTMSCQEAVKQKGNASFIVSKYSNEGGD